MQMPRGAVFDQDHTMPAPINATVVPASGDAPATAPPAMPPELRYQYGDEIARGGMGRVVEATETVLGRTVALKEALALDPEAIQRFHRESRITARLEHPSIVPIHDAGTSDTGAPFYVMRKISGRSLEELVGRAPELADRLALNPHKVAAAKEIAHADELQRFLTGQLVKSHHYSNRDKLLRWVRNNRALVAVAVSSLVALLAIAAFSFSRILAARDRADGT